MDSISKYRARIYKFIFDFVKDPALADDLTQDIMLKAWVHREKIGSLSETEPYIMKMAKNHVMDHFKKLSREKRYQQEIWHIMQKNTNMNEGEIGEKEINKEFTTIIRQLPPRQREIYELSREKNLSLAEIAETLQIAPNTAKNHLVRALHFIRTHLKSKMST